MVATASTRIRQTAPSGPREPWFSLALCLVSSFIGSSSRSWRPPSSHDTGGSRCHAGREVLKGPEVCHCLSRMREFSQFDPVRKLAKHVEVLESPLGTGYL